MFKNGTTTYDFVLGGKVRACSRVGALEALQDEVAVSVGLVAEPRLLAWRDRAVAHDLGGVGPVRGGALAAVGAPAPGVRAALSRRALP